MESTRRGCLQVYTGNGKGKTTAALGLAMRATGHGQKVIMIMFMKGCKNYGEIETAARCMPGLDIEQFGLETFVSKENPTREDIQKAQEGIARAMQVVSGGGYDVIILDEINVALDYNLITLEQVMKLIESRPPHVELVFTGRYAHEKVIGAADLVSVVDLVKHPFYHGVEARRGIEY